MLSAHRGATCADMSGYTLGTAIISLSVSKTWDQAKLEWGLNNIYMSSGQTCLCGHYPISEICVLKNKLNQQTAEVGNCCVEKFIGLSTNKVFAAIKRISKDINKAVNADVIELAHERGYISKWDRDFYIDTWRKRVLSPRQQIFRVRINHKILANVRDLSKQ